MSGKIILDLTRREYIDEFAPIDALGNSELWQQQAQKRLVTLLEKAGREAASYKTVSCDKKKNNYHHAVCISGSRGAGKTVFLRSAKNIWGQRSVNEESAVLNLHFTEVIDPTLLEMNDRFSDVIIATIYSEVENCLKDPAIIQEKKNVFYQTLKKLSEATGSPSEFDNLNGIDRILKYRSGIHIEKYFHQFLSASVSLLECDAIVIPIDDVDMKIDNAFDVLDDIRRLLSCPLVIPLVSGDYELYSHLTTMKFEDALAKKQHSQGIVSYGEEKSKSLSSAYLTKVFPNDSRLPLLPIADILPKITIKYQSGEMNYSQYEKAINSYFYALCNGEERSVNWPRPENAREVTQLTKMLPPEELLTPGYKEVLWSAFKIWAIDKQDGPAWCNAESYSQIISAHRREDFSLSKIISFNPKLQIQEKHQWSGKSFYNEQKIQMEEIRTKNIKESAGKDMNQIIFDSSFSKQDVILRSMPVLEYIKDPMYLSSKVVKNNNSSILTQIYTHHDYYSQQLNRRYHIFFSRAFEILSWSLLAVTGNIPYLQNDNKDNFNHVLLEIFEHPPFYSIFAVNPTKMIEEDIEDEGEDSHSASKSEEVENFNKNVVDWLLIHENSLRGLKGINLLPLLSAVFNKVFSQLHILRKNLSTNNNFKNETLYDLTKRFEYIFINALASFLRDGEVVNTNVATSAKSDTVRDISTFISSDRTLSRNISGLVNPLNKEPVFSESKSEDNYIEVKARLISALWKHPVFSKHTDNTYPIGSDNNKPLSDSELSDNHKLLEHNTLSEVDGVKFKSFTLDELLSYYKKRSGNKTIAYNKVMQWAKGDIYEAKGILGRLNYLYDENPKVKKDIDRAKTNANRFYYGIYDAFKDEE